MNKITLSSPAFRGKMLMKVKLCKVYRLECQQVDEICFRYNKICKFDTLERQTMGVQAHSRWLHAIRKRVITEKNVA